MRLKNGKRVIGRFEKLVKGGAGGATEGMLEYHPGGGSGVKLAGPKSRPKPRKKGVKAKPQGKGKVVYTYDKESDLYFPYEETKMPDGSLKVTPRYKPGTKKGAKKKDADRLILKYRGE